MCNHKKWNDKMFTRTLKTKPISGHCFLGYNGYNVNPISIQCFFIVVSLALYTQELKVFVFKSKHMCEMIACEGFTNMKSITYKFNKKPYMQRKCHALDSDGLNHVFIIYFTTTHIIYIIQHTFNKVM